MAAYSLRARAGHCLNRRSFLAAAVALPGCAAAQDAPAFRRFEIGPPARPFLQPLGGLELRNAAWGFGGLSGLHLAADLTLSAISDRGHWWQAPLLLDRDGLAGLGPVRHGPLLNGAGQPMRGSAGDAEALTRLPNGEWLIAYERQHRILRHARLDAAGRAFPAPPGLEASPANAGLEALTVLADGRLLAITERLPAGRNRAAWVMERERWTPRDYRPADGLDPTDAAGLPGGGALVLERSFSLFGGFTCRLAHLADVAGPVLQATTWLDLPEDAPAENWEGVAVTRHARGKLVALVSDDNESVFQRSLLVLYRVV